MSINLLYSWSMIPKRISHFMNWGFSNIPAEYLGKSTKVFTHSSGMLRKVQICFGDAHH